jgi:hypothetical protein
VPYLVINTGMMPHQMSAFAEGLFGPLHTEFERTPKAASVTTAPLRGDQVGQTPTGMSSTAPAAAKAYNVKVHWPYVVTEVGFVAYQLACMVLFGLNGLAWCMVGAAYLAGCVIFVAVRHYGDHAGRLCFVVDTNRPRKA